MDAKQSLSKRSSKSIAYLFKQYLMIIEDLKFEHDQYLKKIKLEIPSEFHNVIDNADTFDNDKLSRIRKRVLDIGNETIRSVDSEMDDFSVNFVFKN
jgi:hypothetical protein